MKHALLFVAVFTLSTVAFAQVPQQINYQAVVRNATGQPLANGTQVSVKFIIHDGS